MRSFSISSNRQRVRYQESEKEIAPKCSGLDCGVSCSARVLLGDETARTVMVYLSREKEEIFCSIKLIVVAAYKLWLSQ